MPSTDLSAALLMPSVAPEAAVASGLAPGVGDGDPGPAEPFASLLEEHTKRLNKVTEAIDSEESSIPSQPLILPVMSDAAVSVPAEAADVADPSVNPLVAPELSVPGEATEGAVPAPAPWSFATLFGKDLPERRQSDDPVPEPGDVDVPVALELASAVAVAPGAPLDARGVPVPTSASGTIPSAVRDTAAGAGPSPSAVAGAPAPLASATAPGGSPTATVGLQSADGGLPGVVAAAAGPEEGAEGVVPGRGQEVPGPRGAVEPDAARTALRASRPEALVPQPVPAAPALGEGLPAGLSRGNPGVPDTGGLPVQAVPQGVLPARGAAGDATTPVSAPPETVATPMPVLPVAARGDLRTPAPAPDPTAARGIPPGPGIGALPVEPKTPVPPGSPAAGTPPTSAASATPTALSPSPEGPRAPLAAASPVAAGDQTPTLPARDGASAPSLLPHGAEIRRDAPDSQQLPPGASGLPTTAVNAKPGPVAAEPSATPTTRPGEAISALPPGDGLAAPAADLPALAPVAAGGGEQRSLARLPAAMPAPALGDAAIAAVAAVGPEVAAERLAGTGGLERGTGLDAAGSTALPVSAGGRDAAPAPGMQAQTSIAGPRTLEVPVASAPPGAPLPMLLAAATGTLGSELGEKILWLSGHNLRGAEIQLDPPELGPLQVQIHSHRDGTSVQFTTHTAVARDAVEATLPRLRELLEGSGLSLLDVNVSQQQRQGQRQAEAGFLAPPAVRDRLAAVGQDVVDMPRRRPAGLVDAYA